MPESIFPFELSVVQLILAWAVVAVGAALQGAVGFGLGIIGAPLLVLIAPGLVPGPLLLVAFVLTLLITYRERRAVDLAGLQWAVAGRFAGVVAAAVALTLLPRDAMSTAIALSVLVAVGVSASGIRVRPGTAALFGAGALSGLTGTIASIGGPPMAMLYLDAAGPRLRGTLSGQFVLGTLMSLLALGAIGKFSRPEFVHGIVLLPGMLAGFGFSGWLVRHVDKGRTKTAVLAASALAGVMVLVRQALG